MVENEQGSDIPDVVKKLTEDLTFAVHDVGEYKIIFSTNDDEIELLNSTAQLFFLRLHRLYWTSFVASIGRLLDPEVTFGKRNLSVAQLRALAKGLPFETRLEVKLRELRTEAESIVAVRNKFVAHRDLDRALTVDDTEVRVTLRSVERTLELAAECLQFFHSHFRDTSVSYDTSFNSGGAKSLVGYLRRGRNAFEQERQALLDRFKK